MKRLKSDGVAIGFLVVTGFILSITGMLLLMGPTADIMSWEMVGGGIGALAFGLWLGLTDPCHAKKDAEEEKSTEATTEPSTARTVVEHYHIVPVWRERSGFVLAAAILMTFTFVITLIFYINNILPGEDLLYGLISDLAILMRAQVFLTGFRSPVFGQATSPAHAALSSPARC